MMRRCTIAAVLAVASCGKSATPPAPTTEPTIGTLVAAGPLRVPALPPRLSVLLPETADIKAMAALARRQVLPGMTVEATTALGAGWDPAYVYAPPDRDGAPETTVAPVAALVLAVADPAQLFALARVAGQVATAGGGWILNYNDVLYTPHTLETQFLATPGDVFELAIVRVLEDTHGLRAVQTHGLRQRGLPELVVHGVPRGEVDGVMAMLNASAQTLLNQRAFDEVGALVVDVATLGPRWSAARYIADGGTGRVRWRARWANEPDPTHRPASDPIGLRIDLDVPGAARDSAEALVVAVQHFAGTPDDPVVNHLGADPELLAARARARTELAALAPQFAKLVPDDEHLSVKGRFTSPEGDVEWMWVDVIRIGRDGVEGTLDNVPQLVELTEGERVTVPLADVGDYLLVLPDGTQRGGHSLEILRRLEAAKPTAPDQ